jgi:iron complex transport system substrate-binding protein
MKTKIIVLVGIAICTILLTSPVLASAGYSKIYGNANEDDVLDMRDVTYIKLVIFGKKPATTFADANYDGKISMLDIGQTKLIILGKEKKLTLVDQADRVVTVPRPIERIVTLFPEQTRVYPELKELPGVSESNTELMVSLKPDVIVIRGRSETISRAKTIQDKTGIPVVCILTSPNYAISTFKSYRIIGKIIEKEEEAEELISYVNEELDKIREVTSQISESEKPKVYFTHSHMATDITRAVVYYDPMEVAGGINVASEMSISWPENYVADISKEQIIKWNPDIILIHGGRKGIPMGNTIERVLADPVLQPVNAVKNQSVYYTRGWMMGWDSPTGVTEAFYMAKIFHPDKFKDLDVEKECNGILERFYGAGGLYTWLLENYDFRRWD